MSKVIDAINSPDDLKKLDMQELEQLSSEIRKFIISSVSKTGGHLASNLGTIELTLALHYVFNTPTDKIIWDVGHQCYTHKIITGRKDKFHTLRQYKGISGFPKRSESVYDTFDTGHSGTSISCALGLTEARDILGDDYFVIAVIGDGSTTSGLAFEGMNQTGARKKKKMIVILNDNEMSISPNVGALSEYFSRKAISRRQLRLRESVKSLLEIIPSLGSGMVKFIQKLEEALKGMIVPGMFFEELGYRYVGPLDGNNVPELINTLENVKNLPGPVLVHVLTKKGKGYSPAENYASIYHGAPPFKISTGEFQKKSTVPTYTEVFGKTMLQLAEQESRMVAITAAMCEGTGLVEFRERYPDRFFDVGIAEQHAVTFAAGLALNGIKPVVAIYSTFLQRALDQVIHDVCLQNLPVVFAIDRAGLVGADGETHQGEFDISFLRYIPNLTFMAPKDEREFQDMLKTALELGGPAAVRYPRRKGWGAPLAEGDFKSLPVGKGEIIREGEDLVMIAIGQMVNHAVEAAERLQKEGISAGVINARFIKPLDKKLIVEAAEKYGNVLTIEENVPAGGFGGAAAEALAEAECKANIRMMGIPDRFIEHGNQNTLLDSINLNVDGILEQSRKLLNYASVSMNNRY